MTYYRPVRKSAFKNKINRQRCSVCNTIRCKHIFNKKIYARQLVDCIRAENIADEYFDTIQWEVKKVYIKTKSDEFKYSWSS